MFRARKIRLLEPGSRPGRPFNAWIRRWPLLGPLTLASWLHERGYDARVYNENISGPLPDSDRYEDVLSADVIGISTMTATASRGYELADRLRRDGSAATIVFGGAHATFLPDEALSHGDVVVRGEGETVIEAIARGDIAEGIVDAEPLADLDALPTIDHTLMDDFDDLVGGSGRRELYPLPLMTSRGCPYGCTYCCVTRMFGRRVRRQSVDKVHAALKRYADAGFGQVFFYDDNFTTDRRWTRDLLERMRPMRLRFNAQARVDFPWADRARTKLDTDLLRSMKRAGGDVLYVGYETVDDATAARWNKGYRGADRLAVRLAEDTHILHEAGFWVHGMFVFGPQHTESTARQIVDFARDNRIETIQISVLTPLPGTPLMNELRPHLMFRDFPNDWDFYDGTHCVYDHGRLPAERVQRVVFDAHRTFYRWGGWSLRRVRGLLEQRGGAVDKLRELWTNARTARRTLASWRRETEAFIGRIRQKVVE
ncbi:MAG: cobalamin-dependent protein [Phycisphaerae bacterium]|nr:cobalamin-dependent protein [Phycisphaerae bacterium]